VRCDCGKQELTRFSAWASFPTTVHTVPRCGRFSSLAADIVQGAAWRAQLTIRWPDGSTQYVDHEI
jgi:hypothetical protein